MSKVRPEGAALITGASCGIGRGFAHALARRGMDIVVVARREQLLQDLAAELTDRYGIGVTVLPTDLSEPEAPRILFDALAERGQRIGVLVNNAGFGVPGKLCDVDWARHRATIEVMATAPVRLSYLLAPSMLESRSGWIINVSSLSALLPPHAGGTLYYPVKSFLYQFSLALREEVRGQGVRVTALCPGFTETDFQKAAGGSVETVAVPRWLWTAPGSVAEAAIRATEADRPVCIPGLFNKATAVTFKLLPGSIARWILR